MNVKKRNTIILETKIHKNNNTKAKISKTLNQLIDEWLESKKEIKESTSSRYYNLINEHIRNDIGKIKINKLNNGKINNKGGLSNNTMYDICSLIRQVFNNYNIDIKVPKIQKKIVMRKPYYKKDKKILEKYQKNNESNISLGIELSLLLGLKESELCGLMYKDIDLDNKIIYINYLITTI